MMNERNDMHAVNMAQKEYYNQRCTAYRTHERPMSVGFATHWWWKLRDSIGATTRAIGVERDVRDLHKRWLGDIRHAAVLDLGCFTGNPLSLWLAEQAQSYRGVDLSEAAIAELNNKLSGLNKNDAMAVACDILENKFPDHYFDVIYAKSVMHHFKVIGRLCHELNRILKPGGIIISDDPLQTEPINRIARIIYRPFQDDRDWEWPFSAKTIRELGKYFLIEEIQGTRGLTKLAIPFLFFPIFRSLGTNVGRWGWRIDKKYGKSLSYLYVCWNVTILMRKR